MHFHEHQYMGKECIEQTFIQIQKYSHLIVIYQLFFMISYLKFETSIPVLLILSWAFGLQYSQTCLVYLVFNVVGEGFVGHVSGTEVGYIS